VLKIRSFPLKRLDWLLCRENWELCVFFSCFLSLSLSLSLSPQSVGVLVVLVVSAPFCCFFFFADFDQILFLVRIYSLVDTKLQFYFLL